MQAQIDRRQVRRRIRNRIRQRVSGSTERPRLAVFRSSKHIEAQAIDDVAGRTVAHASSREASLRSGAAKGTSVDGAKSVGRALAERLKAAGIGRVVFDRGGFVYHGRVRALADALREAGIEL